MRAPFGARPVIMQLEIAEAIAADLVRAVRGRRSHADFSRRLGYQSNVTRRWEAQESWPTASVFLSACARLRPETHLLFREFYKRPPEWLDAHAPFSPREIAAFLRELRGKTPIGALAERIGQNRYSVGRWMKGTAQPKLPDFLRLVEAASRRLVDFIAGITDPSRMPTISLNWQKLQKAREAAYECAWSHAVLRALELETYRKVGAQDGLRWLVERLGVDEKEVQLGLEVLAESGQIRKVRGRWRVDRVLAVDTSQDFERSRELKATWMDVAVSRLRKGRPGSYGYSVFAVSKRDLLRLRELHLQYVRAMQTIIAESAPAECVGLYCAELLDLAAAENAFDT